MQPVQCLSYYRVSWLYGEVIAIKNHRFPHDGMNDHFLMETSKVEPDLERRRVLLAYIIIKIGPLLA